MRQDRQTQNQPLRNLVWCWMIVRECGRGDGVTNSAWVARLTLEFSVEALDRGAPLKGSNEVVMNEGLVSSRSFQMLIQWMYLGRVVFPELSPEDDITATIEFLRIVDMCGVTGMECLMTERIKQIILTNKPHGNSVFATPPDEHTYHLKPHHINAAAFLPDGHPVRSIFASATVKSFLRRDPSTFLE
jgi:hypothetical protein